MKPVKTEKLVKLMEKLGAELISSNGHKKYRLGDQNLMIPHHIELSPGTLRDLCRAASNVGINLKAELRAM